MANIELDRAKVKHVIYEMIEVGVVFDSTESDKLLAWTYSRVGKKFALNRAARDYIYQGACNHADESLKV